MLLLVAVVTVTVVDVSVGCLLVAVVTAPTAPTTTEIGAVNDNNTQKRAFFVANTVSKLV